MRLTFLLLLLYHLGKKFPWIHHYRGISLCDLGTQFLLCHQDNVFLWKRRYKKSIWYSSMLLYTELDQNFFGHCSEIGNDIQCTAKEIKVLNIQIIKIWRRAFTSHYNLSFVGGNWAVRWWNILEEKWKDKAKWGENTQSAGVRIRQHFQNKNLPACIVHIYELLHTYLIIRELQHLQAIWISSVGCLCICIIINLEGEWSVCSMFTIFA